MMDMRVGSAHAEVNRAAWLKTAVADISCTWKGTVETTKTKPSVRLTTVAVNLKGQDFLSRAILGSEFGVKGTIQRQDAPVEWQVQHVLQSVRHDPGVVTVNPPVAMNPPDEKPLAGVVPMPDVNGQLAATAG